MDDDGAAPALVASDDALRRRRLNVVGHELRTPVAALAGLADRLVEADIKEVRAEIGPAIQRLAHRTETLLDDLLVATEISTALPVEEPDEVDLAALVHDAWNVLGAPASLQIEGEAHARVGREAVERAVTHLLRNAATYGDGSVQVRLEHADGAVTIRVVNHGVEPDSFEVALLFDAFYRGEQAVTRAPGLGLGLSVARQLVRHAGGDVTVSVEPDGRFIAEIEVPAA